MREWMWICVMVSALSAGGVWAQVEDREIAGEIARLGDADYSSRESATLRLKRIGKAALPLLREAAANATDVETRSRAKSLIRKIEFGDLPGGPVDDNDTRLIARNMRLGVRNGVRSVEVNDGVRDIIINDGPGEIEMKVSAMEDGRMVSEVYKAASRAELRAKEPQAYKLFDRWTGGDMGVKVQGVQGLQLHGNVELGPRRTERDGLEQLAEKLDAQTLEAGMGVETRKELFERIEQLKEANLRVSNPLTEDAERQREMKRLFAVSDGLRERMAALKLEEPGGLLPPPAKVRLGIQFSERAGEPGMIVVEQVVAGDRGEKLGIRAGDVLRSVNGKPIASRDHVRPALLEGKEPVVIEVERGGRRVRLVERGS